MQAPPHRTYYRACIGRWVCALDLAVTDAASAASLPLLDRMRLRSSLLLPLRLTTTVAMPSDDVVLHTTRVSLFGVPMLASREVLTLDPDGSSFTMHLVQREAPFFLARTFDAHGRVDETATHATYRLQLFGVDMLQTTIRDGDHVTLTQETAFSRGVQRLRRVR